MAMTAKELIAKKTDILARNSEEFDVEIEGVGVWRFRTPNAEDYDDANVYAGAHKKEVRTSDPVIIYNMVVEPNLRDAEVAAAFSPDPDKPKSPGPWVVETILMPGQISNLVGIMLKHTGYDSRSVREAQTEIIAEGAEQVKNS